MLLNAWLLEHGWAGAGLTAVVVASDYALTQWGARLYRANTRVAVEGSYETAAVFRSDVDRGTLSVRALAVLCAYVAVVGVIGSARGRLGLSGELYLFLVGFFTLVEVPIHLRHLSNVVSFRLLRDPAAADGAIRYSRRYVLRTSAAYFLGFAGAFALSYASAPDPLTAGGGTRCAVMGLAYLLSSLKLRRHLGTGVA